ncbi:hypothetical protein BN126_1967 [Cronobacter sakazakii 680]|nr:hypothetical protein BN126_1967 [Cronobacter sakazakii 680]
MENPYKTGVAISPRASSWRKNKKAATPLPTAPPRVSRHAGGAHQ